MKEGLVRDLDLMVESANWQMRIHPWDNKNFYYYFLKQWSDYFTHFQETLSVAKKNGLTFLEDSNPCLNRYLSEDLESIDCPDNFKAPLWPMEQLHVFPHYMTTNFNPMAIVVVEWYFKKLIIKVQKDEIEKLRDSVGKDCFRFFQNYMDLSKSNPPKVEECFDFFSQEDCALLMRTLKATNYNFLMTLIDISESIRHA